MKHSLAILACAGVFLATSLNKSQAQSYDPNNPGPAPDYWLSEFRVPTFVKARMVGGHVVCVIGDSGPFCARYNISWTRQGLFPKWVDDSFACSGKVTLYTIPERALPNTVYTYKVQAESVQRLEHRDEPYGTSYYDSKRTQFVELFPAFKTPPGPSVADKKKVIDMTIFAPEDPRPFAHKVESKVLKLSPSSTKADSRVSLKPSPISGKHVLTTSTLNPNVRVATPGQPLTVFEKTMARPTPPRPLPMTVESVK